MMLRLVVLLTLILNPLFGACVKRSLTKLRSGPGRKYSVLWGVRRNMPLKILKKKNRWGKVQDLDGDVSWVNLNALKYSDKCGIVKVQRTHAYMNPHEKIKKEGRNFAQRYEVFKIKRNKGPWTEVKDHSGQSFWVASKDLWVPDKSYRRN